MGIFDGCLLATDIDGTLVYEDYLSKRNIIAVNKFVSDGGCFCLATGRGPLALTSLINMFKTVSPSVLLNGGMIYDFNNSKIIYSQNLTDKEKEFAKVILRDFKNTAVEIHCGDVSYSLNRTKEMDEHDNFEFFKSIDTDFDAIKDLDWNKALYMLDGFADHDEIFEAANSFGDIFVIDTSADILGKKHFYIEQVHKDISKASALKKLAQILDIKRENVYAVGDYYNDYKMLEFAGVSCCPDNSPDDIKKIVDFIGCHPSKGTVADFIEYLYKTKTKGCK